MDENQIKGICLETIISALFSANKWFVERNVIALKAPNHRIKYEVDIWASKILLNHMEEWKIISCKNVKENKILKSASEEIHSHIFKTYSDSLSGRVSIRGFLAFADENVKDSGIFKNLKIVSPVDLNIDNMIQGFERFGELIPNKSCVLLYLLFLIIENYIAEKSYTLKKLRQEGYTDYEFISLAKYKYNIKKSLAWEFDPKLRFYELFRWYQSNPKLQLDITHIIVEQQKCTSEEAKNDFNVQCAYYLQIRNKLLSTISVIRNALSCAYNQTQILIEKKNPLVKRLTEWKLEIMQDYCLLSSIVGQFQYLFNVMGGTIFNDEFDKLIVENYFGSDIQLFYKSIDYFEKLFPLKNGAWFTTYASNKGPGKFYKLRPNYMKHFAYFSRYYLCIKEGIKPKEYYETGCMNTIKLLTAIDVEWKIFERFSLYKDEIILEIINRYQNR